MSVLASVVASAAAALGIPETYHDTIYIIKRIYRKCGVWPYDFLGSMSPGRWSKMTLEKLSKLVTDAVAADKMSEAKNYLLDNITKRYPHVHLEPRDCEIASRWFSDQCSSRRSKRHSRAEKDPAPEEAEAKSKSVGS
ncbi:hypothetical protein ACHAPI_012243 [Fusarium lateritium]